MAVRSGRCDVPRYGGWRVLMLVGLLVGSVHISAQTTVLTALADRPSALYRVGETVTFEVTLSVDGTKVDGVDVVYRLRLDDFAEVASGTLQVRQGEAQASYTFEHPSWILLYVTPPKPKDGKAARPVLAGAMCEPERLEPGAECPGDFEAFWDARKQQLDAVPFAPVLDPVEQHTDEQIETYAVQLKNINGTTVYGFFAKPKGDGPFPAVLKVNAAGVYGIAPGWVARYAKHGALALDINPHDIPNGKPQEFYDELKRGALRGYQRSGCESRETSYFLRMFCSCYRAARYLCSRSEWDGEHLVVCGSSQGGGQAIVTAGLCPQVTAFTSNVPALCDHSGILKQRRSGWPQWVAIEAGVPDPGQLQASRYYDCANFAPLTKATALLSSGFIDRTCSPTSVWAVYNQLSGNKEMVNMVQIGHAIDPGFSRRQQEFILHELGLGK